MNQDRLLRVHYQDFGLPAWVPVAVKDRGSANLAVNPHRPAQTVFPDGWIATRSGRRDIRSFPMEAPNYGATRPTQDGSDREK